MIFSLIILGAVAASVEAGLNYTCVSGPTSGKCYLGTCPDYFVCANGDTCCWQSGSTSAPADPKYDCEDILDDCKVRTSTIQCNNPYHIVWYALFCPKTCGTCNLDAPRIYGNVQPIVGDSLTDCASRGPSFCSSPKYSWNQKTVGCGQTCFNLKFPPKPAGLIPNPPMDDKYLGK